MVDASLQRKNMVESQVRPNDITDRRIIRSMLQVPRETFLPPALRSIAYMDEDVPLRAGSGRTAGEARAMMAPRVFAKLVQLAEISDSDIVLDIGIGSGYSAAVIANLCETVVGVESDVELAEAATKSLEEQEIDNVVVVQGPLNAGYPSEGPFDAIVVEGRICELPDTLLDQLKDGGRLVAIHDAGPVSHLTLWRRIGGTFDQRTATEVGAPALPGFDRPQTFVF